MGDADPPGRRARRFFLAVGIGAALATGVAPEPGPVQAQQPRGVPRLAIVSYGSPGLVVAPTLLLRNDRVIP